MLCAGTCRLSLWLGCRAVTAMQHMYTGICSDNMAFPGAKHLVASERAYIYNISTRSTCVVMHCRKNVVWWTVLHTYLNWQSAAACRHWQVRANQSEPDMRTAQQLLWKEAGNRHQAAPLSSCTAVTWSSELCGSPHNMAYAYGS